MFVLSSPPMAALLVDGWAACMEQVSVMHANEAPGRAVYRMLQYVFQEDPRAECCLSSYIMLREP